MKITTIGTSPRLPKKSNIGYFDGVFGFLKIVAIIGIAALLAFVVVPFLHSKINDFVAKFVWYPSCVLFVVSTVATVFKKPKTPSKYPIFDFLGNLGLVPIVVIFSSAFLINYFDTTYSWWWAIFVLIALFLPFFVF